VLLGLAWALCSAWGLALVSPARAADVEAILEQAAAAAADDPGAAADLLSGVAVREDASAEQRVRATQIAFDRLPFAAGNAVAAELVLATLRDNHSQPAAWQLALRIRDRVMDGLDLQNGEPFLRSMIDLYPDQMRFRHYLANLYLNAGRPGEADRQCMEILRQAPADTRALHIQAYVRELDGRKEESLDLYARIHDIDGDLDPLVYRVRILIDSMRDYSAAETALEEAFAAVDAAPVGRKRNAVRASLEYEQRRLQDERERRADLLDGSSRLDRLLVGILAGWFVILGGGLVYLRRRGLV
jgi:tetratricopeptide (TPR) repeat protein